MHGRAFLVGKLKRRMSYYFLMQCFGVFGMKEIGVFEGVEMPLQCFKDYFIKALYFWDKGIFCYSSLDLLDFVDTVYMGCV